MAVFRAVLDTCVLFPIGLTDLLLTAGRRGLYQPYWSPQILEELRRNLRENTAMTDPQIEYRIGLMGNVWDAAQLEVSGELIDAMTNDPKDRHVLAAAVRINADVIVTADLAGFSASACKPFAVDVQTPDEFVEHLVSLDATVMYDVIEEMATRRRNPPETPDQIIDHLEATHTPAAMQRLRRTPQP